MLLPILFGATVGYVAKRDAKHAAIGAAAGAAAGLLIAGARKVGDVAAEAARNARTRVISAPDADVAEAIFAAYPRAGRPLSRRIVQVARAIGADPFDLANVIAFESHYTFNPRIQFDQKPGDGFDPNKATGLIQFIPSTARSLGTTTEALYNMTALEQMDYVQRYFERVKGGQHYTQGRYSPAGPLDTIQALFMAIFEPHYRYVSPTTRFPESTVKANTTPRYTITTPLDYLGLALRNARLPSSFTPAQAAGMVDWLGYVVTGALAVPEEHEGLRDDHPHADDTGASVGFLPAQSWAELAQGPGPHSLERMFLVSNYTPDKYGWAAIPSTASAYGSALANTPAAVVLPNNTTAFGTGYGPAYLQLPHDAAGPLVQPPSYAWQQNTNSRTADAARALARALQGERMYLEVPFRSWPGGWAHGVTYRPTGLQDRRARRIAKRIAEDANLRALWFDGSSPGTSTIYFTTMPQALLQSVAHRRPKTRRIAGLEAPGVGALGRRPSSLPRLDPGLRSDIPGLEDVRTYPVWGIMAGV